MGITLWVTVLSVFTLLVLEKLAKRIYGAPLVRWQRLLLPVFMFGLLSWNLTEVLALGTWTETHPGEAAIRYASNQIRNPYELGLILGCFIALLFIPSLVGLSSTFWRVAHFSVLWWFFHLLWLFFVLFPLALFTGMPLQD